jgi:hypothetical protein
MKYFEKTADLAEWWGNRKEDLESAKYLAKHKYHVYKGGRELGADPIALLKHDWSKLMPSLWVPYREFFHGENRNDPKVHADFREAIKKHEEYESHHDYKYKNKGKPNLENYADWYSVAKTYNPATPDIKIWLRKKGISY